MKLNDADIENQWHDLLEACGDHGPGLLSSIEEYLAAAKVPGACWSYETATTGLLGELIRKRRREYLVIRVPGVTYEVAVGARSYGTLLALSWYLVPAPPIVKAIRQRLSLREDGPGAAHAVADLSLFERADLAAFVTLTRLALRFAIHRFAGKENGPPLSDPLPSDWLAE